MILFRESRAEDALFLGPRLREADAAEVKAAIGMDGTEALTKAIEAEGPTLTFQVDDEVVAMFGVVPQEDGAVIWALGSDRVFSVRKSFLTHSARWLAVLNNKYPHLYNFVDSRNTASIRWLKWLGFTFIGRVHFNDVTFIKFERHLCATQLEGQGSP